MFAAQVVGKQGGLWLFLFACCKIGYTLATFLRATHHTPYTSSCFAMFAQWAFSIKKSDIFKLPKQPHFWPIAIIKNKRNLPIHCIFYTV